MLTAPDPIIMSPTDFVVSTNQALEYAMQHIMIEGELSEFKVRKGRWLYFKIKDDMSVVDCFGTVYMLPGPIEDGAMIRISGLAKLHPAYGFSFQVQSISISGEGNIKKTQDMLRDKLASEGLFDDSRKRPIEPVPASIGLVTSAEGAAVEDFIKVSKERWPALTITVYDTLVQGERSPDSIINSLVKANQANHDVIVITRGGGSAEDLAAFSHEQVVRAVAASKTPTMVAIGHEIDESLSELVSDARASTPSNAAELLMPDMAAEKKYLDNVRASLGSSLVDVSSRIKLARQHLAKELDYRIESLLSRESAWAEMQCKRLGSLDPDRWLRPGLAMVSTSGGLVKDPAALQRGDKITLRFKEISREAEVK